ncbi:PTS lactose transporter subunit IIA [Lentilactobacillus fungorum]|uniref:PTS lactose transporter subunit IIA n=1 Tax=Lentilactobacillus fungorum TaxID=2201250 RepID=A0ABQ3VXE9_9LACO|nr:PTS lactose/cellobiose transporter subunit IIA [Lentilactobacillus fungorum]GHP12589.1 PTS lactose transporter subunit IIA [Lentilactobacillus fungorum]
MDIEELNQLSMKILTYSGKAKQVLNQMISQLSTYDQRRVQTQFDEAHRLLIQGHHEQSKAIKYVDKLPYSVLFTHAQDTLMSTETIYYLLQKLIPLISVPK